MKMFMLRKIHCAKVYGVFFNKDSGLLGQKLELLKKSSVLTYAFSQLSCKSKFDFISFFISIKSVGPVAEVFF